MAFDPWTQPRERAEVLPGGSLESRGDVAAFMAKVYRWMAAGLGLTGVIAMAIASSDSMLHAVMPLFLPLIIGELILVFAFSRMVRTASFTTAAAMFLVYAALNGVTFSVILRIYTPESVASVFFITAGAFGGMSVFGTVTKRDLSAWAGFLMMGLFGVIIAGVVNIFVHSSPLNFIISCASVVVFAGLTAWNTQQLRSLASVGDDRLALSGALSLYLDFVNLFLSLLRLFGRRR